MRFGSLPFSVATVPGRSPAAPEPGPGTSRGRLASCRLAALALAVVLFVLPACGDGAPALRVDGVEYAEEDLLGLSADREHRLVALTALGLAFARDEVEAAGAPLLDRRREDLLLDRFAADLVLESAGVEEDVLRAQYLTNPRYELVVRHVVALAEEGAADSVHRAARAKARRALERIEAGEPMADVAADLSEEPGAAERGGRLQPGRRGSWVPEFWEAANALEEGEHTGVVRTEYGYHVIQLEERRVVPFEEVRSDVVLRAGRMLGGTEEAWHRWTDSLSATIRLDTAALRTALEDGALSLDPLAFAETASPGAGSAGPSGGSSAGTEAPSSGEESAEPVPGASTVLAAWEAGPSAGRASGESAPDGSTSDSGVRGRYRVGDLRRHLASLEKERWRELTGGGVSGMIDEIRREALRKRGTEEARDRGLRLSSGPVERTAREWRDRAAAWAASLGFQVGDPTAAVRNRALEALSTTRQNASIARRELEALEPLLRAAYPVRAAQDS